MPVHQISVSPMGGSNINNKQQNCNSNISGSNAAGVPSIISCNGNGGGGGYDSQTSSLSSNSYDICRICHCEGDSDVPLIAPCYCAGSLRYVHQVCLQQWIKSSNIRSCELCKFQFIMQTKTKPFSEWEHLEMSGFERRKLFCAVMFHAVALTCVVWSLYVLIDRTAEEIQTGILEWPFWTKLIVVAIGFTGGVVFMYIQCKAYLQICQRWKAFNRVIYVQNAPEKPHLSPSQSGNRLQSRNLTSVHPSVAIASVSNMDYNRQIIEPSSSEFKPYQDGMRDGVHGDNRGHDRDETSIDLKGVRNLHIFFNDENRIHVQKDRSPSCKIDCLDDNEVINSNEYGSIGNNNNSINNGQTCPSDNHGNLSWHIKIGKTSSSDRTENNDRTTIDSRIPDLNQLQDEGVVSKNNNTNNLESPVLKLQIKKAEIVIKFGQKAATSASSSSSSTSAIQPTVPSLPNVNQNDTAAVLNDDNNLKQSLNIDNNDSSVNIKFDDRQTDNSDPIVIDLVQNQSNAISTSKEQCVDNSSPPNPVQIRLDFGCKEVNTNDSASCNLVSNTPEDNTTSEDSLKLLSSSLSEHLYSNRPLSERPYCSRNVNNSNNNNDDNKTSKSEPGSGSRSPLLTKKDYDYEDDDDGDRCKE